MADDATNTVAGTMAEPKRRSLYADVFIRLFKEKPLGTIGMFLVLLLLFTGVFADWLAPYPMGEIDLAHTFASPSGQHLLGTDNLGRDMMSRIIYGARISVIIGLTATCATTVISVIIGSFSALLGGKFDILVQRFVDGIMCIPMMLILLTMMSIMGKGMWQIIVALSVPGGIVGSRIIRSAVIAIKENTYVEAGRAIGCSTWVMFWRHILPNIMPVIIISFSLMIGGVILMEAGLSFLGFGVPPGVPSWGSMLSQEGRQFMEMAPLLAIWPGLALTLVVYGTNMFGDALRDLLDPKLKGGVGRYSGVSKKKMKIRPQM